MPYSIGHALYDRACLIALSGRFLSERYPPPPNSFHALIHLQFPLQSAEAELETRQLQGLCFGTKAIPIPTRQIGIGTKPCPSAVVLETKRFQFQPARLELEPSTCPMSFGLKSERFQFQPTGLELEPIHFPRSCGLGRRIIIMITIIMMMMIIVIITI